MFKKALQVVMTFGVLLAGYASYVRFFAILTAGVAPQQRPQRSWEPEPSKGAVEAVSLAGLAFGPDHWTTERDLSIRYYNHERGYWMYARNYKRLNDGKRLQLEPFAIIWKSRDGKGLKTATSDQATIDLDQPLGITKAGSSPMKVLHARIEGNVLLRDDKGTHDNKIDDLVIGPTPYFEYDEHDLQIKSESLIHIKDRDMRITGFNLLILLRPREPGTPAASPGTFDAKTAFLQKDVYIVINDVGRSGILSGSASPGQMDGGRTPLDIRSAGPMQVDLPKPRRPVAVGPPAPPAPTLVSFRRDVVVRRGKVGTTPDELDCDELHLKLVPAEKRPQAQTKEGAPVAQAREGTPVPPAKPGDATEENPAPPSATGAGTELTLREAWATGYEVWLRSKSQGITAQCNELMHKKLLPDQADETYLRGNAKNKLRVQKIETITEGPDQGKIQSVTTIRTIDATIFEDGQGNENATVVARGPGILETRPAPDKPVQRTATWQDHLVMRTEIGHDKRPIKEITLTGLPELVDERATLDARKAIVAWLSPKPKSSPFAENESYQIEKLKALEDVHLNAPGKVVNARHVLDVVFESAKPPILTADGGPPIPPPLGAGAAGAAPAAPAPGGPRPPGEGAPEPKPETKPAEPGVTVIGNRVWAKVLLRPDPAGTSSSTSLGAGATGNPKGEVQKVMLRGAVAFHQDPEPGKTRGTDVTGEALDVTTLSEGKMMFVVDQVEYREKATATELAMAPHAKVSTEEMTISGPTIGLNQQTDIAQVRGPGTLVQMAPRGLFAEKGLGDGKPEKEKAGAKRPLRIMWEESPTVPATMRFLGRGRDPKSRMGGVAIAEFSGRVRAAMDDAQLACEKRMDVYMDRAVSLSKPKSKKRPSRDDDPELDAPPEPKPEIALLDCFGDVVIESKKTDPTRPELLLQKQRIMGERVTYDKATGNFEVPGAGRVYLWNRDVDDGSQTTASRATVKPVANPNPPPTPRRATAVTGRNSGLFGADRPRGRTGNSPNDPPLKLTLITFDRAMKGRYMAGRDTDTTETRWAHFFGDVQALNAKVANPEVEFDFDRPPDDYMFLTAQTLHVISEPTPGAKSGAARNFMKAVEEAQAKTRNETIKADLITYDSSKDLFYAYAEEGRSVSIAQQSSTSQPLSTGQTSALVYNRRTGDSELIRPMSPVEWIDAKSGVRAGPPKDPKIKPPKAYRVGPRLTVPGRSTIERKGMNTH